MMNSHHCALTRQMRWQTTNNLSYYPASYNHAFSGSGCFSCLFEVFLYDALFNNQVLYARSHAPQPTVLRLCTADRILPKESLPDHVGSHPLTEPGYR